MKIEFGTDGIRGVAGIFPLDPVSILKIGRALGKWAARRENPTVVIGRDTRISGGMIGHALIAGLLAEGVNVTDAGMISTPGLSYLVHTMQFSVGVVISASHNPVDQNGIKLFGGDGFKLSDGAEAEIENLIESINLDETAVTFGSLKVADFTAQYAAFLSERLEGALQGISVVLDCANGAASHIAPMAFRQAGASVHPLKHEPNGMNINVHAGSEFVRRDRSALLSAIRGTDADLGIAFDGDADRCVIVTPDGMLIDGDHILGILAAHLKAADKLPGLSVVATDMSNSGLEHYLAAQGITLIRTKVGDRYVMEKMRANDYILGGEQAGHIILLSPGFTSGDGIYAGMLVAALAAAAKRNNSTLTALAQQIPRYPQVIANAHLSHKIDLKNVTGLNDAINAALEAFEQKGRVNIRFSGTEPNLLRAMVEGGPASAMSDVVGRAIGLCKLVAEATNTENPVIDVIDCVTGAPVST